MTIGKGNNVISLFIFGINVSCDALLLNHGILYVLVCLMVFYIY